MTSSDGGCANECQQTGRLNFMHATDRPTSIRYLLAMRGVAMLPDDDQLTATKRHRSAGAIHFDDFSVVGRISGYGNGRLQRAFNGVERISRNASRLNASLPERLSRKPADLRYEFRAIQRSKSADVEFGLALLSLAGYEIQFAGGPFGGGLQWIYRGYHLNDMGAHFWGGGHVPECSKITLALKAYKHRNEIGDDLRRAIEINHFATFAPNEDVRMLLCVSALERLAGSPPELLPEILPQKSERKALLDALDAEMTHFKLPPDALSRIRSRIAQTQRNNSAIEVRAYCERLGVGLRNERWDEAFKTRHTLGHGGTPAPASSRFYGDDRIWDALHDVVTRLLERDFSS